MEIVDAQLEGLTTDCVAGRVKEFQPDFAVVTTAPSYLFWRCAPPELRVPRETMRALRGAAGALVAVGPHASTTPRATLAKLGCDAVVMGECEEVLPELAGDWAAVDSLCYRRDEQIVIQGRPHASDMSALPALHWPDADIRRHSHHHHRFDSTPVKPGAEMETSRGCPYHCTFCAKDNFRNNFRRRPLAVIAEELDGLVAQGVEYVYFIDEIFLPFRDVLELIGARRIRFGIQTRLDLWTPEMIALLGAAGCVSIEAGVESITEAGRARLDKKCKISTADITDRLVFAKESVGIPFVQANLLDSLDDDPAEVEAWRGNSARMACGPTSPCRCFPIRDRPITHCDGALWTIRRGSARMTGTWGASTNSATSRSNGRRAWFSWKSLNRRRMPEPAFRRVLMTGDTVGGVWTFTLELAEALGEQGVEVVLATFGGLPSPQQEAEAVKIPNLYLRPTEFRLEWMPEPWHDVEESGRWLLRLANEYSPDAIHLNTFGHGALPFRQPVVQTAHSCVLSWWEAVRGGRAPAEWDRYAATVKYSLLAAGRVTAPSHAMAATLRTHYGFTACETIYNGRNAALFRGAVERNASYLPLDVCGMRPKMRRRSQNRTFFVVAGTYGGRGDQSRAALRRSDRRLVCESGHLCAARSL